MELDEIYEDVEGRMKKSVENLKYELSKVRTGRASPLLLQGIKVDYFGTKVSLQEIAGVKAPEPRLLIIQPWDKNVIGEIEKAIRKSGLGLNPLNDGNVIRIQIPPLSDERRQELTKLVKKLAEEARIAVRNIRRDGIEKVKNLEKKKIISEDEKERAEKEIQDKTEKYIEEINETLEKKIEEIMEK